jgi:hypothetical protein
MKLRIAALVVALIAASACGGGGDDTNGDNGPSRPSPTGTVTFGELDPAILSTAVLRREDLGAGFRGSAALVLPDDASAAVNAVYEDGAIRVQSSIALYESLLDAEGRFQHVRRILPSGGAAEENYTLPGAETAYFYKQELPPTLGMWALAGQYVIFLFVAPIDPSEPDPRTSDEEYFRTLANIISDRLPPLLQSPLSVTPVSDVLTPPAGASPIPTDTPVP